MRQEHDDFKVLSITETANIFGVNTDTVHFWINCGKLKYIPAGKKQKKIAYKEVQRFLEEEQQKNEPNPHLNMSTKEIVNEILDNKEESYDTTLIFKEVFK
ncbi:MAG: helix-turn-helix domain-containing protein [Melioribacteraceae bacterium]|nr:helix-turn-helix domain-containing protein [Melioribacteraceae bacterium]